MDVDEDFLASSRKAQAKPNKQMKPFQTKQLLYSKHQQGEKATNRMGNTFAH